MRGLVMRGRAGAIAFGITVAALGCGGPSTHSRTESTSTTMLGVALAFHDQRPDEQQLAALRALAARPGSPSIAITSHGGHIAGGMSQMADRMHPTTAPPSSRLTQELDSARRAAVELMQEVRLSGAGYYLGSYYSPGIGTHYIDWRRVGQPFDPAGPSMLLVDATPNHTRHLAGFSYWVRSNGPPKGFDGDGDMWHQHRGLCFIDAVMTRESVANPSDCEGDWIDGGDLWMLHVWVVPGYENADGVFAPTNPKLCPPRVGPDAAWC